MITEDYVSFDTAKLLKEKGFDEITLTWYSGKGKFCIGKNNFNNYQMNRFSDMATVKDKNKCSAPTMQMAMKWLREVHHIFIQVELYSKYDDYCFEVFQNTHRLILEKHETYNNYEEACDAAIKYCLENLV